MSCNLKSTPRACKHVYVDHCRIHCRVLGRHPLPALLKLRLCTPNNAAALCVSLLVPTFFKNIHVVIISAPAIFRSGNVVCLSVLLDLHYMNDDRSWINLAVPLAVLVVSNWAVIGDPVTPTTSMCLGVSLAFIVGVVPGNVFVVIDNYWPMPPSTLYFVIHCSMYLSITINFFLYSVTEAHFQSELVPMFRSIQRGGSAAAVVHRMPSRATSRLKFHRSIGDDLQMQSLMRFLMAKQSLC